MFWVPYPALRQRGDHSDRLLLSSPKATITCWSTCITQRMNELHPASAASGGEDRGTCEQREGAGTLSWPGLSQKLLPSLRRSPLGEASRGYPLVCRHVPWEPSRDIRVAPSQTFSLSRCPRLAVQQDPFEASCQCLPGFLSQGCGS